MVTASNPTALSPDAPCPCGSALAYGACCAPLHEGSGTAASALALMRSRYAAYVLDRRDYLLASWHPRTRPAALPAPPAQLRWLGLQIKGHAQTDATHAWVEFVARSKLGGRAQRLHETSRFVCEHGRWLYLDGDLR